MLCHIYDWSPKVSDFMSPEWFSGLWLWSLCPRHQAYEKHSQWLYCTGFSGHTSGSCYSRKVKGGRRSADRIFAHQHSCSVSQIMCSMHTHPQGYPPRVGGRRLPPPLWMRWWVAIEHFIYDGPSLMLMIENAFRPSDYALTLLC